MSPYSYTNSKGVTYYLHETEVTLRGGQSQAIRFFAKGGKNAKGRPISLPDDVVVKENPRNGFLTVSRRKDVVQTLDSELDETIGLVLGDMSEVASESIGRVRDDHGAEFSLERTRPLFASSVAIQYAELRELIASKDAKEADLQRFLEANPEAIPGDHFEMRPQVVLELGSGDTLRPDFMLRSSDGLWDLLELKLPRVPLITTSGRHPRISSDLTAAIAQLRNYAYQLDQAEVRERLIQRYGVRSMKPRLQLVIGRGEGMDREHLRRVTDAATRDVTWYTWDDVLAILANRVKSKRQRE